MEFEEKWCQMIISDHRQIDEPMKAYLNDLFEITTVIHMLYHKILPKSRMLKNHIHIISSDQQTVILDLTSFPGKPDSRQATKICTVRL